MAETSSAKGERSRKDGMQEGLAMPSLQKKRKDGVMEVTQADLMDSSAGMFDQTVDWWVQNVTDMQKVERFVESGIFHQLGKRINMITLSLVDNSI